MSGLVLLPVTFLNAWLACSASFCAAILDSIDDANRLAITDPDTDILHLSPRDIIIAMTALYETMRGAEVDALCLPLRKKLTTISDLPGHIVAFRGALGRLATDKLLFRSMFIAGCLPPYPPSPFSNSTL